MWLIKFLCQCHQIIQCFCNQLIHSFIKTAVFSAIVPGLIILYIQIIPVGLFWDCPPKNDSFSHFSKYPKMSHAYTEVTKPSSGHSLYHLHLCFSYSDTSKCLLCKRRITMSYTDFKFKKKRVTDWYLVLVDTQKLSNGICSGREKVGFVHPYRSAV